MKRAEVVCIIDDDPIFVFGAQRLMNSIDFCNGFLIFHNGKKALDYLIPLFEENVTKLMPDIILLDLNMPILDGWQFLDQFSKMEIQKKTTIFIVSSSMDSRDLEKAKTYEEIKSFITKPLSKDKLRLILEECDVKVLV